MPENWKTYKLGDVADIQNGYAFKSGEMGEKGIPILKIKNIVPPNVVLEGAGYYIGKINNKLEKFIVENGDFLIAMTGSTVNVMSSAVGKMGKYRLDDIALLNQRAGKIFITDTLKADFEYVCHFLNRYEIHYNLALNATGSANQANISPAQIKDIEITLPPLPEQKAIASILSALDDKIELNLQMNKTLEEMSMALYKHWFVDFGPFQNCNFVESELGMIPEGWEVKRLGDFVTHQKGFAFKSSWYQEYGKIVVRVSDTTSNSIDLNTCNRISEEKALVYDAYKLKTNDIIIATVGSWPPNYSSVVGKVVRVPSTAQGALLNQNAVRLSLKINDVKQQGLLYCTLKTDRFLNYIVNSAQGSASQASIKLTDIFNYPLALGKEIQLKEFSNQIETYLEQQNTLIEENHTLTTLRDTLLPKLISGKVRVKDIEQNLVTL